MTTTEQVRITRHSASRIKSRCGHAGKHVGKLVRKSLERGITHADASGGLRHYLDTTYLKYRTATNMRVFANNVYLFAGRTLVTVLNLPPEYIAEYEAVQRMKNIRMQDVQMQLAQ